MELTQEVIAELKAKHGEELVLLKSTKGPLVFRKPTRVEWEHYKDQLMSDKRGKSQSTTERAFVTGCFVWPDGGTLSAAFEEKPGIISVVNEKLCELVGMFGGEPETAKL